jgi:acyl transferase domain-containing protein/acyl carrier protein
VVNSFGFAGALAAAVLEQAPRVAQADQAGQADPARDEEAGYVFTLSAKGKRALGLQVARYQEFLAAHPDTSIGDLCYTANLARQHFPQRVAGVVRDRDDLTALLAKHAAGTNDGDGHGRGIRRVAFLFTGQGSQYPGMGRTLYRDYPVFREHVDECDRLFEPLVGRSVRALLLGGDADAEAIHQTRYAQPALFTMEYALARLWLSFGVRPNAVLGHSIGEVVAACVAGVFRLADAVMLVATRGRLMQAVTVSGGMLAIPAPAAEIGPMLERYADLALAAVNSPKQCVVSGGAESLAALERELSARGIDPRTLPVSQPFHSPLMAEVYEEFTALLGNIRFRDPRLTLISNVTGEVSKIAQLRAPEYWVRQIGAPVNFQAGVRTLEGRGRHLFVEIGPSGTLTALAKQCVTAADHRWLTSAHPKDQRGSAIRAAVSQLYASGMGVSWPSFHAGRPRRLVRLPTYAFDRKRYWLPLKRRHAVGGVTAPVENTHPLLGAEVTTDWQRASGVREFCARLTADSFADHVVNGQTVLPSGGYVEILLALQDAVYGQTRRPLRDLWFGDPLVLTDEPVEVRARLTGGIRVEVVSTVDGVVRGHVTGTLAAPEPTMALTGVGQQLRMMAADPVHPAERYTKDEVYADLEHGPRFRRVERVARYGTNLAVGEVDGIATGHSEHQPPALVEAAVHLAGVLAEDGETYQTVRIGEFRAYKRPRTATLRAIVQTTRAGSPDIDVSANVLLLEGDEPVFVLIGLGLKRVATAGRPFLHQLQWLKRPLPTQPAQGRHVMIAHRTGPELGLPGGLNLDLDGVTVSFAASAHRAKLILRELPVTDVIWFWRGNDVVPTAEGLRAECERNYQDLLDLVDVLVESGFGHHQRLWLATEKAQLLPGDTPGDGSQLAAATLWGFGHSLLNEYPAFRTTLVDLPDGDDLGTLLAEIRGQDSGEFQVAYRGGARHVHRLVPAQVPESGPEPQVDRDHTYVITGGLGALGLVTAEKLVDQGARHLALVGRSGQPAPEVADLLDRLRERAEVTVYVANVADELDVRRLTGMLATEPHPVGGIVHAAGEVHDMPISTLTWEAIDQVFAPKVYGGWLLHRATALFPHLKFFVGYSSGCAVIGAPTQANYAGANAFLDQLLVWRAGQGLPGLTVNWGPWGELGMSARLSELRIRRWHGEGIRLLSPAKGTRAMISLLGKPMSQVTAGEVDWDRFSAARPVDNALYQLLLTGEAARKGPDLDALFAATPAQRSAAIDEFVRGKVADVLHIEDAESVDPRTEFVQLGLDSLVAVELKNALESAFHIPLPASIAFDCHSAGQLAEFIDTRLFARRRAA